MEQYLACMNKITQQKEKGFALLLALIISSIALSIGLSMLHITLKQLTLGTTTRGSEVAFQAANAGMECLRYARSQDAADFITNGGIVTFDCLGQTSAVVDVNGTDGIQEFHNQFDWSYNGESLCIEIEAYLLNAVNAPGVKIFPNRNITKTCALGDICTIAFSRGYNRSCADVGASIFTVQREISIEF